MKYSKITTNLKQLCLLSASTLLLTASSFAQFLGLESEVYATTEFGTTYRIYATFADPMDECIAVYSIGTAEVGTVDLELGVSTSFWHHEAGSDLATGIAPFFILVVPELAYDSWLTVGPEDSSGGSVSSIGMGEAFDAFNAGDGFILNGETGGSWYVIPGSNLDALAGEDGKVLLAQLTVADEEGGDIGNVWCDWNIQWRNEAGVSTAVTGVLLDTSNSSSDITGCMDETACNYDPAATVEGTCDVLDECGDCGGDGIADGECDCDGNVLDACGVCGGDGFPEGTCDCEGTVPDEGYDCSGDCLADADNDGICDEFEIPGCSDSEASNYDESATDDDDSCLYSTVFNVDMSCAGVDFTTVHLTGPICDWCGSAGWNDLTDTDGDLIYSVTIELPSEVVEYKYMVDNWANQEDLVDDMANGASCAPVTDYSTYANRLIAAGSTSNDTYGSCTACADQEFFSEVSFEIDMNGSGYPNADFDNVVVNGSWNGWAGWGVTLADLDGDGIFTGSAPFEQNIDFEFVIAVTGPSDGWSGWGPVFNAPEACSTNPDLPLGEGGGNYGASVGTEALTIAYCAGSCDATCPIVVLGCMDETACNYDATATEDDDSCEVNDECGLCGGGGIAEGDCDCDGNSPAEGYDCDGDCLVDSDSDGVCDAFEIGGCTDESACNYNSAATDDNGSCAYAEEGSDCSGDCLNDFDGDGVCNSNEVAGCTSTSANNYNDTATDDDGTCEWPDGLFTGLSYELIGHDLIEGSSTYRLYANFSGDDIQVTACYGTADDNWSISSTEPFHQDPNGALLAQSINPAFFAFFPDLEYDSWLALGGIPGSPVDLQSIGLAAFFTDFEETGADVLVNTVIGASLYYIPGEGASELSYPVNGQMLLGQFTTSGVVSVKFNLQFRDVLQESFYATDLNMVFPTFGVGCTDSEACNYDLNATDDDGTCFYDSAFRDCDGVCLEDVDGDDVCDAEELAGCTLDDAWNYNADATDDDGSCIYAGCFDELACNYEPTADLGVAELCTYPAPYSDCDGNCNGDYEGDGVDECAEVSGCASESANNYNPLATNDDGSCEWGDQTFLGMSYEVVGENTIGTDVTYRLYANFNPEAVVDMTSLFGNSDNPWLTMSTGDFYQHPLGADFGGNINPGFFGYFPELEFDSWLTIGAAPGDYNALAQENMYLYLPDFNAGNDLIIDSPAGAQIFLNEGSSDTQGMPDDDGKLLLGQFTTSGVVFLRYNIRFQNVNDEMQEFTDIELTMPPIAGGCMDSSASNYDSTASFDDMTCIYDGCTDEAADNYYSGANLNDGSCLYTGCMDAEADNYYDMANTGDQEALCEYFGCMDETADNYDGGANVEDGSCLYSGCMDAEADNYDPGANAGDQEALCEYLGCMDETAFNYDAGANVEDDSCLYQGCMDAAADNYDAGANLEDGSCLYSGCMDAEADNYDAGANTGDQAALCEYSGCMDETADNYDAGANVDDESCLYSGCMDETADNYDGGANVEDGSCLYSGCMDAEADNYDAGANTGDQAALCEYLGCMDETADNYDAGANVDDESCLYSGCMDETADNYDAGANVDDDSCLYSGCMDVEADNYNAQANTGDQDALCLYSGCMDELASNYDAQANTGDQEVLCEYTGCTNPDADNYNVGANLDDGSCIVAGCWYADASNFDPASTYDDGSCEFPSQGCTDATAFNYNENAVTDNGSCLYGGCTYLDADNFSPDATVDDGSCVYAGCMDDTAANYDDGATVDDGSCLNVGCMDPDGLNYDESANFPGGCDYPDACPGDINYDGFVDVSDLLTFFQFYGMECGAE